MRLFNIIVKYYYSYLIVLFCNAYLSQNSLLKCAVYKKKNNIFVNMSLTIKISFT